MGLMTNERYKQIRDYVHPKCIVLLNIIGVDISLIYHDITVVIPLIKMAPENLYDTK